MNTEMILRPVPLLALDTETESDTGRIARLLMAKASDAIEACSGEDGPSAEDLLDLAEAQQATNPSYAADMRSAAVEAVERRAAAGRFDEVAEALLDRAEAQQATNPSYAADLRSAVLTADAEPAAA